MPRYYCDYCDTYLTHDSPSVRKQHNAGYKHKANVRSYYQQFEEQQTQSLIDQRIREHLGQAAAFQSQVGAAFNAHLMRPPIMRPPILSQGPMAMAAQPLPGAMPPILPRPVVGAPGYGAILPGPPHVVPPGAPSMPMQMNSFPRPPALAPPSAGAMPSATNGAVPLLNPMSQQANHSQAPGAPSTAGSTASHDGFSYGPASEANH